MSRLRPGWLAGTLLTLGATGAWAQQAPAGAPEAARGGRPLILVPSASITQTFTDNGRRGSGEKQADAITELTAGLGARARTADVQAALDYTLSGSMYARESRGNRVANALSSHLSANLIDQWLHLDAAGSIQQSVISAFGPQTIDPTFDNGNTTETRAYLIAPSLRRPLGSFALLDMRASYARQSSDRGSLGDSTSQVASVRLSSLSAGRFGWDLMAQRARLGYDAGSLTTDSVNAGLVYRPSSDLSLRANAGQDRTDVLVRSAGQRTTSWGVGLDWVPSRRTRVSLQRDERYFGVGHRVQIEHRLQRMLFSFSSSRDVSTPNDRLRTGTTTLFDLLFASLEATEPDPLKREQLVLQRLLALGRDPRTPVSLNFLSSGFTVRNTQDLGVAWNGPRSSASLTLHRNVTERLENAGGVLFDDDLAFGGQVRQQGVVLSFGHRLTPATSLSADFSHSRNEQSATGQSNTLRSVRLGLSGRLGRQAHWGLGARHVEFDSTLSAYTENAIYATLGAQF